MLRNRIICKATILVITPSPAHVHTAQDTEGPPEHTYTIYKHDSGSFDVCFFSIITIPSLMNIFIMSWGFRGRKSICESHRSPSVLGDDLKDLFLLLLFLFTSTVDWISVRCTVSNHYSQKRTYLLWTRIRSTDIRAWAKILLNNSNVNYLDSSNSSRQSDSNRWSLLFSFCVKIVFQSHKTCFFLPILFSLA